jgi:hypothetical protein
MLEQIINTYELHAERSYSGELVARHLKRFLEFYQKELEHVYGLGYDDASANFNFKTSLNEND